MPQGDITLTSLGETFAEASIQARKEIFATRMRRLPLFQWLLSMLQAADTHQLEKDVLIDRPRTRLPTGGGARQVEVAINWGRYAELLAYNNTSGESLSRCWRAPGDRDVTGPSARLDINGGAAMKRLVLAAGLLALPILRFSTPAVPHNRPHQGSQCADGHQPRHAC